MVTTLRHASAEGSVPTPNVVTRSKRQHTAEQSSKPPAKKARGADSNQRPMSQGVASANGRKPQGNHHHDASSVLMDNPEANLERETTNPLRRPQRFTLLQRTPSGFFFSSARRESHDGDRLELGGDVHQVALVPVPSLENPPTLGQVCPDVDRRKYRTRRTHDTIRGVRYLDYGPYASFAPTRDSEFATCTYEEAMLMQSNYAYTGPKPLRRVDAARAGASATSASSNTDYATIVEQLSRLSSDCTAQVDCTSISSTASPSLGHATARPANKSDEAIVQLASATTKPASSVVGSNSNQWSSSSYVYVMQPEGEELAKTRTSANGLALNAKVATSSERSESNRQVIEADDKTDINREGSINDDLCTGSVRVNGDSRVTTDSEGKGKEPASVPNGTIEAENSDLSDDPQDAALQSRRSEINGTLEKNVGLVDTLQRYQNERFWSGRPSEISEEEQQIATTLREQLVELAGQTSPGQLVSVEAIERAAEGIPVRTAAFRGTLPNSNIQQ